MACYFTWELPMSTLAMASSSFKLALVTAPHGHCSCRCHRSNRNSFYSIWFSTTTTEHAPKEHPLQQVWDKQVIGATLTWWKLRDLLHGSHNDENEGSSATVDDGSQSSSWRRLWVRHREASIPEHEPSLIPLWMSLSSPTLGIFLPLVATVNDGIIGFQVVKKGCDGLVNESIGLNRDDDRSVLPEGRNEGCNGMILWWGRG